MNGDSRTSDNLGDVRPGDVQDGAQGSAQQRRVLDLARNEWPCLALGLLSIPIILYGLGSYSLVNGDEHIYHVIARTMVESGHWLHLQFYDEHRVYDTFMNAPLQYWARALVIAAFGDDMWTARILTALTGVASVLATERLGRRLSGSRLAGFGAGLIQLTTLQFIYLHGARTGELEPVLTLLYTLAALFFLRSVEEKRSFVAHHICLALMLNLKAPTVIVPLMAEIACFALIPATRAHFRRWLGTGLLVAPLALVWHVGQLVVLWQPFLDVAREMTQQAASHRSAGGIEARALNLVFYARTLLYGAFPYSLVFPLAVVGLLRSPLDQRDGDRWRAVVLFAAAVLVFYVAVSKHHHWYVMPMYPMLSVFLATWLHRLPGRSLSRGWLAALAVVLGLLTTLRVNLVFNPFLFKAWLRPMNLYWRESMGDSVWPGLALAVAAALAALVALRHFWPRQATTVVAAGLAVGLAALGLARVLVPLRYLEHKSETVLLRIELDELERSGAPLPDPIQPSIPLAFDAPYYLGDRYEIVETDDGSFILEPRRRPRPRADEE